MASEVDISNLALARLGNRATVSSLDPPEGSAEAAHCAIFYPIARDSLQEMHQWSFTTRRDTLALLGSTPPSEWLYAYALPTDLLNILAVTSPDASDDYSTGLQPPFSQFNSSNTQTGYGLYSPQPYVVESLADGTDVLYTNQMDAVLRFTVRIIDATKFSPLFVDTLSTLLASHLAGPILKGAEGRKVSQAMLQEAMQKLTRATASDSGQRRSNTAQNVSWIVNR